ncbi:MAG TPA: hypothetical protein PKN36_05225 [bacterium]|nr:hypothetical protein [bacterium]
MKTGRQTLIVGVALLLAVSFTVSKLLSYRKSKLPEVTSAVQNIFVPEKKTEGKLSEKPVRVVHPDRIITSPEKKGETEYKGPEWFSRILSVHEKYYPSWKDGKTVVSSLPSRSLHAGASSVSPQPGTVSPIPAAATSTAGRTAVPSAGRILSSKTTSETGSGTAESSAGGGGGGIDTGGDDNGDTPPANPVMIVRSVSSNYVTLNITVNTDISGLIIVETLPPAYSILSATPNYSKKSNNDYRWLIYGKSVPSQTVTYRLDGSGGGSITGTYKSTKGSGVITGSGAL